MNDVCCNDMTKSRKKERKKFVCVTKVPPVYLFNLTTPSTCV
jgi:hypothetical protein